MDADQFKVFMEEVVKQFMPNPNVSNGPENQMYNISNIQPFETFDAEKENFKFYQQRFENYLKMKNIFSNKNFCHQMLLNSIGSTHFKILVAIVAPKEINEFTYDQLMKKLEEYLCPKVNVLVAQHKFLSLYQTKGNLYQNTWHS